MVLPAPMHRPTDIFVEQHQDRLLEELKDFLRIPSISTLPEHQARHRHAPPDFVAESLRDAGMENVEIIPTAGNPSDLRRLAARPRQTHRPLLWAL